MYKKIILSILFILISFPVLAEEEEEKTKVPMTELSVVHPITCGSSEQASKIFKKEQLVFIGLMPNQNVVKVFINKEKGFAILMENVAELSCIYFSGMPGLLQNNETKKTRSEVNGEYLYN